MLRPGARLALSDLTAVRERLPRELSSLEAWVACLGDARSVAETEALLGQAGLVVELAESQDQALAELLDRIWRDCGSPSATSPSAASPSSPLSAAPSAKALGYCIVQPASLERLLVRTTASRGRGARSPVSGAAPPRSPGAGGLLLPDGQTSGQFTTVDVFFSVTSPASIASLSSANERRTRLSAPSLHVASTTCQSGG